MFSTEYAVEIEDSSGESYSLFVTKDRVSNGNGDQGQLYVNLLGEEKDSKLGVVYLPSEIIGTGTRTIKVPMAKLVPL
jgi:hypothetical protein